MNRFLYATIFLLFPVIISAQQRDALKLTPIEIETIFLSVNLELLAGRMDVDMAEAAVRQARLRENPSLSVSDLNLWSSRSQREGESEVIPPLFGKFGRNTQFSVELNQMIQTAGKRRKLIRREEIFKSVAEEEFNDLMRGLIFELREAVNELLYVQEHIVILEEQYRTYDNLSTLYGQRVHDGNALRGEYLRLQSSALELESQLNEQRRSYNEQQRVLKTLLNFTSTELIWIPPGVEEIPVAPELIPVADMAAQAVDTRPDARAAKLTETYERQNLRYEKSLRAPDVSVGVMYDRRGGVWRDFVGFGVGVDIPLFNRNQGNIKAARIAVDQSRLRSDALEVSIRNEIMEAYYNYSDAYSHFSRVNRPEFISETRETSRLYAKYLTEGNISMLEFVDFMDAHLNNALIILTARKELYSTYQTLKYITADQLN